jgi:UDP-glucose 4-epimerase
MKTHQTNTTGTLNVLIAARDSDVKKIIYASSSSVYGSIEKLPYAEEQQTIPLSPYGVSKLAAERYCTSYYKIFGLKTVSLRYFTVYGPRQRPDMAIRIFVDQIFKQNQPIIFGDGMQTRDFTYVLDVVEANMLAMKKNNSDGGIFNIGSGKNINVNDLMQMIVTLMSSKIKPIYDSVQLGDVKHTLADITKAKKILNWRPKVTIEKGLQEFIDWYMLNNRKLESVAPI